MIQAVSQDLRDVNPYVDHLQHFHSSSRHRHHILELKDFSTNGDFTAVMHALNSTDINPHSVVIQRHGHCEPEFINILSRHYEPLHYVLLFLHGDAGWGTNPLPNVPRLSQIDWYQSRLLTNDDKRFTLFGGLCCEYLVDMYFCTEEERLAYILHERRFRANEGHQPLEGEADDEQMEPTIKLPASLDFRTNL